MSVAVLKLAEAVALDRDQLEVLYRQLGPVGADKVVQHALEELSALLEALPGDYRDGRFDDLTAGARALAAVAESVPDLVVLDVMLPGLDGIEVEGSDSLDEPDAVFQ